MNSRYALTSLSTVAICDPTTDLELFTLAYDPEHGSKLTHTNSVPGQAGIRGTRAAMPGHKLYIATTPGTIHYVGRTTDIVRRLRHGHQCRIKARNGYHGYKWLPLAELRLFICHLPGVESLAAAAQVSPEILVERLESELVFHIRTTTGYWPMSQHEIHFHNISDHRELAELTTSTARQLYYLLHQFNSSNSFGNIQAEIPADHIKDLVISANQNAL